MIKTVSTVFLCMTLSACAAMDVSSEKVLAPAVETPNDLPFIKQEIADLLKDPTSVMFKDMHFYDGGNHDGKGKRLLICTLVNGKNSYGGYTGYELFYARFNVDTQTLETLQVTDPMEGGIYRGWFCDALKSGKPVNPRYAYSNSAA